MPDKEYGIWANRFKNYFNCLNKSKWKHVEIAESDISDVDGPFVNQFKGNG